MARRRSNAPNRTATRRPQLRLIKGAESATGGGSASGGRQGPPGFHAFHEYDEAYGYDDHDGAFDDLDDLGGLIGYDDDRLGARLDELTGAVATSALAGMAECRRPLEAELLIGEILASIESSAPAEAGEADVDVLTRELLLALVDHATQARTPAGAGLLRVLAGIGPERVRARARFRADQLAASGVAAPRWAASVGRPTFVGAWRYGDIYGAQSSVGLQFDYSGRRHLVMTLIDFDLGGGVKDCFVATGRRAESLRAETEALSRDNPEAYVEDLDAAVAAQLLGAALAEQACPQHREQVETMLRFEPVLRSRVRWLESVCARESRTTHAPAERSRAVDEAAAGRVLRLKVSLARAKPPVWRRLELPASATLGELHAVLQVAFGWDGVQDHRYERVLPSRYRRFAAQVSEIEQLHLTLEAALEGQLCLDGLFTAAGDELLYRYGRGETSSEHYIRLEATGPVRSGVRYPRCTGGRRSSPPGPDGGTSSEFSAVAVDERLSALTPDR